MKTLLRLFLVLFPVLTFAAPPPLLRNSFTTNTAGQPVEGSLLFNGELYSAQGYIAPFVTISNAAAGSPGIYPFSGDGAITFDGSGIMFLWDGANYWQMSTNSTLSPVSHTILTNWNHSLLSAVNAKVTALSFANRLVGTTADGTLRSVQAAAPYLDISSGVLGIPIFEAGFVGQVWTSGSGSAGWSNKIETAYGELYLDDASVGIVVTNAGTYYPIIGFSAGISNLVAIRAGGTFAAPDALIPDTNGRGVFACSINCSFSGTANRTAHVAAFTNGVKAVNISVERKLGTTGDVGAAAAAGFFYLEPGVVVTMRLSSEVNGDTFTFDHCSFRIHRISVP